MSDPSRTSREEDYRDYEQRDLRDGWPYADEDGAAVRRNAPYGAPKSNFDEADDAGAVIASDPAIRRTEGEPQPFSDDVDDAIEDDALEERIVQALDEAGSFDLSSVEIIVRDGVASVEGAVDSDADRRRLLAAIRVIRGVRDVSAEGLSSRGVDSHIPADSDE